MESKKYVKELLEFWIYKLDNNLCTPEELQSIESVAEKELDIQASIKDIATFYGMPEVNVRMAISRRLLAKPKRVVLYPFQKFAKVVSEKWIEHRANSAH